MAAACAASEQTAERQQCTAYAHRTWYWYPALHWKQNEKRRIKLPHRRMSIPKLYNLTLLTYLPALHWRLIGLGRDDRQMSSTQTILNILAGSPKVNTKKRKLKSSGGVWVVRRSPTMHADRYEFHVGCERNYLWTIVWNENEDERE